MADKLVTIAEYMDSMEAELAKQVLADHGIQGILLGSNAADGRIGVFETVKLQVMQSNADEAKQLLESAATIDEPAEFDEPDWSPEQEEQ
jgi:hypothetical protein